MTPIGGLSIIINVLIIIIGSSMRYIARNIRIVRKPYQKLRKGFPNLTKHRHAHYLAYGVVIVLLMAMSTLALIIVRQEIVQPSINAQIVDNIITHIQ